MKAPLAAALLSIALPMVASATDAAHMMPQVSTGKVVAWQDMDGGAAGKMTVWVWTPPGYGTVKGKRYPVLYMHDGQNLFDPKLAGYGKVWEIDQAITRMSRRGDLRQWIVVGIASPKERLSTMFPEALFGDLPPAFQDRVRALFKEVGEEPTLKGTAYQRFVAKVVKPRVDQAFKTLPGRSDTAVMGSSFGGLASIAAIAAYPDIYGSAAALSVTASLASPVEKGAAEDQAVRDETAAFTALFTRSTMRPGANHIYLDNGTGTSDGSLEPYVRALADLLKARGWKSETELDYRTFAGAAHDEIAWGQRVEIPLGFLDSKDP